MFSNSLMRPHYRLLSETKQQYRQIFHERREALEAALRQMRLLFSCDGCPDGNTEDISGWILPLHPGCGFIEWQKAMLDFIESDVAAGIVRRMDEQLGPATIRFSEGLRDLL